MRAKGDVNEVKEVNDKNRRVAAFFDLDGTLMSLPSLEERFFRMLHHRREIPFANYFLWCREAMRLLLRGSGHVMQANKMYLRGVPSFMESGAENRMDSRAHRRGNASQLPSQLRASGVSEEGGQASVHCPGGARCIPRWPVPQFFEEGVERLTWHAMQGHAIVIVSGTLEPLADAAARFLELELAARGVTQSIRVCATELEETEGWWTGRVLGEVMFGKAKARAVLALAKEMGLDLSCCWAYGDSAQDQWLLAVAGNRVAVNPSPRLARIAKKRGWRELRWCAERDLTQSPQRAQRRESVKEEIVSVEGALQDMERWV